MRPNLESHIKQAPGCLLTTDADHRNGYAILIRKAKPVGQIKSENALLCTRIHKRDDLLAPRRPRKRDGHHGQQPRFVLALDYPIGEFHIA